MKRREYVDKGIEGLLALLEEEHAVVAFEVEAKLSEDAHPSVGIRIDPHHLTTVKRELLDGDVIMEVKAVAKGGRPVTCITLADDTGRKRKIEDAAARKRALYGRYLAWAMGTKARPALLGNAGEDVAHASLDGAAGAGYRLIERSNRGIERLLGGKVPHGPLDDAAFLTTWTDLGEPDNQAVVLIEVKNIREWIYPTARELHQLLTKAAAVQAAHPDVSLLPILICRRAHKTTFYMAQDLGFLVYQAERQFLPEHSTLDRDERGNQALLAEVRSELGFKDLVVATGPDPAMERFFSRTPHKVLPGYPDRWRSFGAGFYEHYREIRGAVDPSYRAAMGAALRAAVKAAGGKATW